MVPSTHSTLSASEPVYLPFDLSGVCFLFLSRYEEAVGNAGDIHGRFPTEETVVSKLGLLEQPFVDVAIQWLEAAIARLWSQLPKAHRRGSTVVTCDLDILFQPQSLSFAKASRKVVGDLLKRGSSKDAVETLRLFMDSNRGRLDRDPNQLTINWIMDVNETAGNVVDFNIIPDSKHATFDPVYAIDDPNTKSLLRHIHNRCHRIGIHPSYTSFNDEDQFSRETDALAAVLRSLELPSVAGERQHYFCWDALRSPGIWHRQHLREDSTLGYADACGFRCGTCRPFRLYDLESRTSTAVVEQSLVFMETVVLESSPGRVDTRGILYNALPLRSTCARMEGDFVILWHNSSLQLPFDREAYEALIT